MLDLLEKFNRDGYVIVENLLDSNEALRLRDICDAIRQGVNVDSEEWWTDYSHSVAQADKIFLTSSSSNKENSKCSSVI